MSNESIQPFKDEQEEIDFVEQMIVLYLKQQKDLGRSVMTVKEIYEFLGSEYDGEDIILRLDSFGENVISLWDAKRKSSHL
jgi:hypothetical protein